MASFETTAVWSIGCSTISHRSCLTVRRESPALHRDGRCVRLTRRDEEEYRQYVTEKRRSQGGMRRPVEMQLDFHHGLLSRSWR